MRPKKFAMYTVSCSVYHHQLIARENTVANNANHMHLGIQQHDILHRKQGNIHTTSTNFLFTNIYTGWCKKILLAWIQLHFGSKSGNCRSQRFCATTLAIFLHSGLLLAHIRCFLYALSLHIFFLMPKAKLSKPKPKKNWCTVLKTKLDNIFSVVWN